MKVVLDTSFIVACGQRKRDYLREIERTMGKVKFIVPSPVLRELEILKKGYVTLGRKILEMHGYEVEECRGGADDCVLEVARRRGARVASFDAKLKRRAREMGLKVIVVRKGAYVMED